MAVVHLHPGYPVQDSFQSRSQYIFLSKIFCIWVIIRRTAVNHGCAREDRKQLPLKQHWCSCTPHALCLNLDALLSVCTQFKLSDQYVHAVSGQQLPSSAFWTCSPVPNVKMLPHGLFQGGEIVLVKHYWHGLTHISSIQGEESQFSFGKRSRKVKGWGGGLLRTVLA